MEKQWPACSFNNCSPDAVDNRDANILDGPEQVLVGDEISPDGAAVGAADVLGQVVQEHSVHPDKRETNKSCQRSIGFHNHGEGPYLLYQSSTD